MKLLKPHFTLRPSAFQIYCYLWKKLELLPEAHQETRVVVASKGEIERELGFSINTVRQSLDQELERDFNMIRKLPDESGRAKNRILLVPEKEWNWNLIRQIIFSNQRAKRSSADDSLFDDLSIFDGGSTGKISEDSE